jgi:hypothetical protein
MRNVRKFEFMQMQSIDILNRSRFANIKPMVMAEDGDFKRQRLVFVLELGQCQHHNKFGNSLEAFRHTSQGCLNEKRAISLIHLIVAFVIVF